MTQRFIPLAFAAVSAALLVATHTASFAATGPRFKSEDGLDLLTPPVDTNVTLGMWLKSHSGDQIKDNIPDVIFDESVCRAASAPVTIEKRQGIRTMQFNVPYVTAGELLPEDGPDVAERVCHLKAIWLEIPEADSVVAHRLADVIATRLTAKYGPGTPGKHVAVAGGGAWQAARTWRRAGTTVVMGIRPRETYSDEETTDTTRVVRPRTVVVVAYAPFSELETDEDPNWAFGAAEADRDEERAKQWRLAKIDSAISRVALPSLAANLRTVVAAVRSYPTLDSAPPSASAALVRAATQVRDNLSALSPADRAAALYAADLVMAYAAGAFEGDTTKLYWRRFQSLLAAGVEYGGEVYMVGRPYSHQWLTQAYELDPNGRAGHDALLELLALGWKVNSGCETTDQISGVIEHGEAAMRKGDIDPFLQYYVGIAYRDRYRLARDRYFAYRDSTYADSIAEESRIRGIDRLRTALLTLQPMHLRHHAWDSAMRLMLRLPTQWTYFCIDD